MADRSVMKRDWNARAAEDAMYYVRSDRDDWTVEEFFESGRESVEATVVPYLGLIAGDRDPKALRVLEIGCGIGRMTRALAELFGEVHGVDVSGEMVRRGREFLADVPNAVLHETSGEDLSVFPNAFFDFAYSFIVFQHIPFRDVVVAYMREAWRTLRPGALFSFQVQGSVLSGELDTWVGVGFVQAELDALADEIGFDFVASEGDGTQYFWNHWRKRP